MIKKGKKRQLKNKLIWFLFGLILLATMLTYIILNRQNQVITAKEGVFEHPPVPVVNQKNQLNLLARAYIVVDVDTNKILAQKRINDRIYPASTTKLVTAMTALNVYPLNEKLKVNEYPEGKNMGLIEGDELRIIDLVEAIIIHSANDAAYNLAKHYSGGIAGFVNEMNDLINKYGLKNSHFVNFDGIHHSAHYSSAYDLAQIARLALKNKLITESAKTTSKEVRGALGVSYKLENTNELLGVVSEIEGLKTGWTPEAGGCFIGLMRIGDRRVLSVVLDSPDRFLETRKIVDWVNSSVEWQNYRLSDI